MGGNRVQSRLISRYGFKLKAKWKPVHPGCLQAKIVSAIFITLKSTSWNHEFHRHTTTQSPQNQRLERTLQSPNGSPRRMSPSRKAQCRFFFSGHHTLKTLISWCLPSVNKKRQDPIKLSSCYVQGPRYLFFFAWYTYTLQNNAKYWKHILDVSVSIGVAGVPSRSPVSGPSCFDQHRWVRSRHLGWPVVYHHGSSHGDR